MRSLLPEVRRLIVSCRRKGKKVKEICDIFGVSAYTIWKWCLRAYHQGPETFEDMPRIPKTIKRKIEAPVENGIIALRTAFNWGTQRIKTVLQSPPPYLIEFLSKFGIETPITLSRQAINNVLKRHRMNGSPYGKLHQWKFFRATKANEMWQIDLRGPIHMYGKRNFILVVIDDYSRYLILLKVYDRDPRTDDIVADLEKAFTMHGKPEKILSDNGGQFKDSWKEALLTNVIEAVFAHPYYPRDKGKVERCIRNVNEEVIRLVKHLGLSLDEVVAQFKDWYNYKRYHQGIKDFPGLLYLKSISTTS